MFDRDKDFKDFIEEVDKLLKYAQEIRAVTNYRSGDKPNTQFIRIMILKFKNIWELE